MEREERHHNVPDGPGDTEGEDAAVEEGVKLSKLEKELKKEQEIRLMHMQDSLLENVGFLPSNMVHVSKSSSFRE